MEEPVQDFVKKEKSDRDPQRPTQGKNSLTFLNILLKIVIKQEFFKLLLNVWLDFIF